VPIAVEIAGGGALLALCAVLHIAVLIRIAPMYWAAGAPRDPRVVRHNFGSIVKLFLLIALSHVVQVSIWAAALLAVGAMAEFEPAVYFALVTYTTLGYGDVVLVPEFRIFGAMAAMTGILCFGLSTALLVGYFTGLVAWREK
jgi:phage baseplate assembly protein W